MGSNPIWFNDVMGDLFDDKSKKHLDKFKAFLKGEKEKVDSKISELGTVNR